jgi:distribution and morphology protein 10
MFFPGARLEAMYVRRISEHLQYLVTAVNSPRASISPQVKLTKKNCEFIRQFVKNIL